LAHKLIVEPEDTEFIESSIWECLSCGLCEERCPSGVEFKEFILQMRALKSREKGLKGFRAHDGAVHSWMRLMTAPDIEQDRLEWIDSELRTTSKGPLAFFVGCAPYFDTFFSELGVNTLSIPRASIKLLNFLDIEPVVLQSERCCGHDLLWSGDRENFEALCRLNYESFKAAGVEEVVVACPECHVTLSRYIPEVNQGADLKVTLLIDMLRREVKKGGISFKPLERRITFHDPCQLARTLKCHETPRELLTMIPELSLAEMEDFGKGSLCCGNSAFVNCDAYSKRIQIKRLEQAKATEAEQLVTACPKCMIHLTCAMRDPVQRGSLAMGIRDVMCLLSEQIEYSP
jgi:Fe-S oxidoreductase